MNHLDAFGKCEELIKKLGIEHAHLAWSVALYLDHSDPEALATESITDGHNDKKIDLIRLDWDLKRIIVAQGYYSERKVDSAPANKASDLNTAAAWLLSGPLDRVPQSLQAIVKDCRSAMKEGEIEQVDVLYIHNLPESVNVAHELATAASHFKRALGTDTGVNVIHRELGLQSLEALYMAQESPIKIKGHIHCPASPSFVENGPDWKAAVMSVPGSWLRQLFLQHGEDLFSANYRGFLGITKRRKINTGIRASAENEPPNFWVYNNGITILTLGIKESQASTQLDGISIINGAQTTGSIGSIDSSKHSLREVKVLCRVIQCSKRETIDQIVKYNNTQNEITTWDQYSNSPEQRRIAKEFADLGYSYSLKRGFACAEPLLGIEQVAQPVLAFEGNYKDANNGNNKIFERPNLYKHVFQGKKARHVLFAYCLSKAIDARKRSLQQKTGLIEMEQKQLVLFRNLRFRYFLIAIVGKCLETILGRRCPLESVGFSPEAAQVEKNSLNDLIAAWLPVASAVLAHLAACIDEDLSEVMAEDANLERIARQIGATIYSSKFAMGHDPFERFARMVSET